jgi:hypothetical protein
MASFYTWLRQLAKGVRQVIIRIEVYRLMGAIPMLVCDGLPEAEVPAFAENDPLDVKYARERTERHSSIAWAVPRWGVDCACRENSEETLVRKRGKQGETPMVNYARSPEELNRKAILYWPSELLEKERSASVIPLLISTQDKFISVLHVADSAPDAWKLALGATKELPANLFLKHLMILSDVSGER